MTDWQQYSLAELRDHAVTQFREAHGSRPDVLLLEIEDEQAVLKDFSHSDAGFRHVIGPLLVYREVRSLKRLAGLHGIPRLIRQVNASAFLLQAVDATPASKLRNPGYPESFYVRLRQLLDDMHARGVAHCDLRSAGNTLIDADLQPWLVDFVASIHQGSRWNLPARWIFQQFEKADHGAVLKLKKRLSPDLMSEKELFESDRERGWLERSARRFGKQTRTMTRKLLTRNSTSKKG